MYNEIFKNILALSGVQCSDKASVLRLIADIASSHPAIGPNRKEEVLKALEAREKMGSSGLGQGIALPHCRLDEFDDFVIGVITIPEGIDFDSIDREKVKVVVFIVGPRFRTSDYLQILATVSHALRQPHSLSMLLRQTSASDLQEVFCSLLEKIPPPETEEKEGNHAGDIIPAVSAEADTDLEPERGLKPEWIVIRLFAVVILLGAFLLCLPFSSKANQWTHPVDSLFMAASAACVTGLSVLDVGSYYSSTGQIIILTLIQFGGLGLMTLGTFFMVMVGRKLSLRDEIVLTDSLGTARVRGTKSLIRRAVFFTVIVELVGAILLFWRFTWKYGTHHTNALYLAIFHSISAFCNAGLSFYSDSLAQFRTDWLILLTITGLTIIGGLGFIVLCDLTAVQFWRRNLLLRGRLSLHSQVVLKITLLLITIGTIVFLALEAHNTLQSLKWHEKLVASVFHSATARTSGFSIIDFASVRPPTFYWVMGLMFIGGSPGSTAGGIKTTTLVLLIVSVIALIRGHQDTVLGERIVSVKAVREALAVFLLGILCIIVIFGILLLTEYLPAATGTFSSAEKLLFETVSAFGTVGYSTGITSQLSMAGKICIIVAMILGRLGPLTVALFIGRKELVAGIRYPEEEVMVG